MAYLEYEANTKQVVEIHENVPTIKGNYNYAISPYFKVGDEFELTIFVNEVDEEKNLLSYSAIRNNPNADRLLRENAELKQQNQLLQLKLEALANQSEIIEGAVVELTSLVLE